MLSLFEYLLFEYISFIELIRELRDASIKTEIDASTNLPTIIYSGRRAIRLYIINGVL
jgi:hypothetical protein